MRIGIGLGVGNDSSRAAREAARQAKAAVPQPKLALAFAGIHLDHKKVHAALVEELGKDVLMGGSSYAEITSAGVSKDSVAVLLLDAPELNVSLASMKLLDNPSDSGRALARAIARTPHSAGRAMGLFFASTSNGYENEALKAIAEELGSLPIFGGLTVGDYDLGLSDDGCWVNYQYCCSELENNGASLAVIEWPADVEIAFGFGHGWQPVASAVKITRAQSQKVFEIAGMSAVDFYRQFLGKDASEDFFQLAIQRYGFSLSGDTGGFRLKFPVACNLNEGSIVYFPSEPLDGCEVQLSQLSRQGLLDGAREAAQQCLAGLNGKKAALAIVISCCARSGILGAQVESEVDAVREVFGEDVPVFGCYAGGEVAPVLNFYEDTVAKGNAGAGSFYHASTICILAVSAPHLEAVAVPEPGQLRSNRDDSVEVQRLQKLLDGSENALSHVEGFLSNLSRKSYQDSEKLRRQSRVLKRYTPHDVWNEVGQRAERGVYELDDAEFEGCFLFLDVKGFTSFSEENDPKTVVGALNELFSPATETIYDCGGDVDKYIGDSIFAVFKDEDEALSAGRRLLELFEEANSKGNPFGVRIGINAGRAIRANVGSSTRREYTYIGDAVNLAQRMEANCAVGKVLVTEGLRDCAAKHFHAIERREISVKGKNKPVVCFECRDGKGNNGG